MLALLALGGCSSRHTSSHPDTLRLPLYGRSPRLDPGVLDPARYTASTPFAVASMMQAGLVKLGPDLHVIPDLAVSLPTIAGGGRTYTFTLRQDARFADGSPVTARTVLASWTRALRSSHRSPLVRQYLGNIQGAGAVEAGVSTSLAGIVIVRRLTLRIRLVRRDASFLDKLSFPVAAITKPSPGGGLQTMGPWRVWGRKRGGITVLRPRPRYYGGPLTLRSVELVPIRRAAAALALYKRGLLDVTRVTTDRYAALRASPDFRTSPALDAYYALPAPGVRRRVSRELNRSALDRRLPASVTDLITLVPPAVPDYVSPIARTDPASAERIAARIVVPRRLSAEGVGVMAALRAQTRQSPGAPAVQIAHLSYQLPDPSRWLAVGLAGPSRVAALRRLRRAERLTQDPVARMTLYGEMERGILAQGSVVPLASGTVAYLIKPQVQSLEVTPLGLMPENSNWTLVSAP